MGIRKRVWEIVEPDRGGDRASRFFDYFILTLILLNVLDVILESVDSLSLQYGTGFTAFETFSVTIFTIEYLARIWSCVENPDYSRPVVGRLRFIFTYLLLVDLIAILPFFLPFVYSDLRFIRLLRVVRILRVLKSGRYLSSLNLISRVFILKKEELIVSTGFMFLLLILSSCLMYTCENTAQPDKFPSIPATMWWAISTLTTVGYGDVYPVTIPGKIVGGIIAVIGIGMFALPTAILGSGFVEEFHKEKEDNGDTCPHCGKSIGPRS